MSDTENVLFNEGARWTDDDIQTLANLYFSVSDPEKRPFDAMVVALGRSKCAIQSEISRRGMAARGAQLRSCSESSAEADGCSSHPAKDTASVRVALNPKFIGA